MYDYIYLYIIQCVCTGWFMYRYMQAFCHVDILNYMCERSKPTQSHPYIYIYFRTVIIQTNNPTCVNVAHK